MPDSGTLVKKAFDDKIFKKYQRAKVSVLSNIRPDIASLTKNKTLFLSGEIKQPVLTYRKNVRLNYDEPQALLIELAKAVVTDEELPHSIKEQYQLVIEEKLTKIKLLRQTQVLACGGNEETSMQLFLEYSKQLYGTIDPNIFYKVMQTTERDLYRKIIKPTFTDEHKPAFDRLLSLFAQYKKFHPWYESLAVTPRTLIKRTPAVTDAGVLKHIFEAGLKEYHVDDTWSVVIDSKGARSSISVSYDLHKIYLPSTEQLLKRSKRKRLTEARVRGL